MGMFDSRDAVGQAMGLTREEVVELERIEAARPPPPPAEHEPRWAIAVAAAILIAGIAGIALLLID